MAKRLVSNVHVRDRDGVPHVFGPRDPVPDWAVEVITNPQAWTTDPLPGDASPMSVVEYAPEDDEEGDDGVVEPIDDPEAERFAGTGDEEPAPAGEGADLIAVDLGDDEEGDDGELPPISGRGSGRDVWAEAAGRYGVPVTDTMSRDDIATAVKAAVSARQE